MILIFYNEEAGAQGLLDCTAVDPWAETTRRVTVYHLLFLPCR